MADDHEVRDFYDEFADYQLGYLQEGNARFVAIRRQLRPLLRRRPQTALDIGCGIGVQTDWLAARIPRVVGVDVSPRSIRFASALYQRPSFAICDLLRDPFPAGPFDLVTAFDVLEHIRPGDREEVFGKIGDVLGSDGVLVITMPSRLFALQNPADTQQVIDEAVGADEIVAPSSGIGLEPLMLVRYGIERTNQYIFAAFARGYDVESVPEHASVKQRLLNRIEMRRARSRGRRQLERVRDLQ